MGIIFDELPFSDVCGVRWHKPSQQFIAEVGYHRINRIAPDGSITTQRIRTTHYLGICIALWTSRGSRPAAEKTPNAVLDFIHGNRARTCSPMLARTVASCRTGGAINKGIPMETQNKSLLWHYTTVDRLNSI